MHLTLLVPELIWPEPGDQLTLGKLSTPGFTWLAARARHLRSPRQASERALCTLFEQPGAGLATCRLLGEAAPPADADGHWLCADPVHLRFHHERIVLADAGAFELDAAEAQALIDGLNAEFADIGRFHAATPRRWYLRLPAAVDHVAAPLSAVAGRRMDSDLADKTSPLHRWLNEAQMYLHGHPVNAARAAAGQPAINSLWLWGGGRPAHRRSPFATLWSDDPLARGLGHLAGATVHPRPASLASLLDQAPANPLVVLDRLQPPVLYEDPEGWRRAWAELEADWFGPLAGRPGKAIEQLDIVAPTIYGLLRWTLPRSARWQFWKKGRPLAELARRLADSPLQGNAS